MLTQRNEMLTQFPTYTYQKILLQLSKPQLHQTYINPIHSLNLARNLKHFE